MTEKKETVSKSRDLDIYTYFEILQLEYICAELRSKIYPNPNDKKYYRDREMVGKKEKILNISERNNGIPNIFNDEYIKNQLYPKVKCEWGFPCFQYKNDNHKAQFEQQDFDNYYMKEAMFKIRVSLDDQKIGKLLFANKRECFAKIKIKGSEEVLTVSLDNIARIL